MPRVIIVGNGEEHSYDALPGEVLGDLLHRYAPGFSMPCGGNHTCGKCLVRVEGQVEAIGEEEKKLLPSDAGSLRLACACRVAGDVKVFLPQEGKTRILAWYPPLAMTCTGTGYGLAADIGTTTVAMQLIDRASGQVLSSRAEKNAQGSFGADVISRIESCRTFGVQHLSDIIDRQLQRMASACMAEAGIKAVEESVVTGNTTMLHIYEGLDPASLAVAPFLTQSLFGCVSRRTLAGKPVYLPRCIGPYVGADITCAILAAGLVKDSPQLLVDIGTNGEIALCRDGELLCCSTAAGPAFEGAGLSCGMPSRAGAVSAVSRQDGRITYCTVDDAPAAGICGSGILDALAVMLETQAMEDTGYMEKDWYLPGSEVFISQKDVRQVQLAKSAICAGIRTLLQEVQLSPQEIRKFVVAGGFGNSMDHHSASAIGLYPAALREKAVFGGNGALGGAVMMLCCDAYREETAEMAIRAREIPLSASGEFMDEYVECMMFGEM